MSLLKGKTTTALPLASWIFVVALAASGCTTLTPLQTASTVPGGTWRLSGQLSVSPWCSVTLSPTNNCAYIPRGIPVPELRLGVRRGFTDVIDGGLSVAASGVVPQGVQASGLVDAKGEVWSSAAGDGRRHLVSLSGGLGLSTLQSGLFSGGTRRSLTEVILAVPVYYGYQTPAVEWVVSPRFIERFALGSYNTHWLGLTAGAYGRGRVKWAVALDYTAPTSLLREGLWTLSTGALWDLGGP